MKLHTSKNLYEYWNELRGNRMAPQRKELDPAMLKDILPNLFLLDRQGPGAYSFRLAGTKTCNIFGEELKDKNFLDLWNENDRDSFVSLFDTLSEQGAVIVCGLKGLSGDEQVNFEFLALPLFHKNATYCSSIIGSFGFNSEVERKYLLPVTDIELHSLRVIWPVDDNLPLQKNIPAKRSALQIAIRANPDDEYQLRRASFKVIQGGKV
ncbi:MAG: PAS domain-containing protein [Rhizobiales bacterium]|nr:PAS domain-containing protein [Hyphomicrobiales bacterium]